MAGLAGKLASALSKDQDKSAVYLIQLHPLSDRPLFAATIPYFPESLTDNKAVDWQAKAVPGASLPYYQWTGSGERTISFTASLATDLDLYSQRTVAGPEQFMKRLEQIGQLKNNMDIRSVVAWLRSNMLPTYDDQGIPAAPNKLMLYIPRSGIGIAGGETKITVSNRDSLICVQTSCEVTWEKFFPSGYPRAASISLSFAQIPHFQGGILSPSVTRNYSNIFKTKPAGATGFSDQASYLPVYGSTAFIDNDTSGTITRNVVLALNSGP